MSAHTPEPPRRTRRAATSAGMSPKKKLAALLVAIVVVVLAVALAVPLSIAALHKPAPSAHPSPSSTATPRQTGHPHKSLPAPNGVYQQPAAVGTTPTEPVNLSVSNEDDAHSLRPGLDGLSLELTDLADPSMSADNASLVDLLKQLNGPMLRFGGNSVERRAFWTSHNEPMPGNLQGAPTQPARTITPADLQRIAALLNATNSTIELVVDLNDADPDRAADFLQHAQEAFGDRLIGYTPGNEPNGYERNNMRPAGWGTAGYTKEAQEYSKAIAAKLPKLPLVGPGTYELSWAKSFVDADFASPKVFGFHHYPFSSCNGADPNGKPTVANMLSPQNHAHSIDFRKSFISLAQQAGLPVWEPEMGPSACPGSDQEYTKQHVLALWAADYALSSAQLGIERLGFHSSLAACKGGPSMSPICNTGTMSAPSGEFVPRANFWGEAFVANLPTGNFAKLQSSGDPMTYSYAIRSNEDELSVVVINTNDPQSNAPTKVTIALPFEAQRGTMAQMSGPAYTAVDQTVIDGQAHVMVPEEQRAGIPGFQSGKSASVELNAGTATVLTFRK